MPAWDEEPGACAPSTSGRFALSRDLDDYPSMQTHQPIAPIKKTRKCRLFRGAAEGFEPSTFCMAISSWE
jgi:hypothetical protein